ncbi:CHAT domain-containing protein [Mycena leptocephala]|nr:CHAT domain-containing protein [Mycena leptocephala]
METHSSKFDSAVEKCTERVQRCLGPSRCDCFAALSGALLERFEALGQFNDLENAIIFQRRALELCPVWNHRHGEVVSNLGNRMLIRFRQLRQQKDIDEAIQCAQKALNLLPPMHSDRANSLNNFATTIMELFMWREDLADLEEAIRLNREALRLRSVLDPGRSKSLSKLGESLFVRFKQCGEPGDIDQAVLLYRKALSICHPSYPDRATLLYMLGNTIFMRFQWQGDLGDIEEAVLLHREALSLRPTPDPHRVESLNNLATIILTRFKQQGDAADIDEAAMLYQEALNLLHTPRPDQGVFLINLGGVIEAQITQGGGAGDIDKAVMLHREALSRLPTPHPDRGIFLNQFANVIVTRFEQRRDAADIDEAIMLYREALGLHPTSHPERARSLNGLGSAIHTRFNIQGDAVDMDEAVILYREALALRPAPHPDRLESLHNLGHSLISLYGDRNAGTDYTLVIDLFREGSADQSGPSLDRLRSAKSWASAALKYCHPSLLEAYQTAVGLLPQIATLTLNLRARQAVLSANIVRNLGPDAAMFAIYLEQYNMAVELLEASRSVFWSQCLQLRTPLDNLWASNPILADKLTDLARKLEQSSFHDTSQVLGFVHKMSVEAEGVNRHRLNRAWDETVQQVRFTVPGFEDFMQPKKMAALQQAAKCGPIIILNAGVVGCHALILKLSGDVQCVPFSSTLTCQWVNTHAEFLQALVSSRGSYSAFSAFIKNCKDPENTDRLLGRLEGKKDFDPEVCFSQVLNMLWLEIVQPVLACLEIQKSNDPPRIWWCPTGPFTFLPIHAAGRYDENSVGEWVGDYVISSYTPAIATLIQAPFTQFTAINPISATVIIQPDTPGCSPLPQTVFELKRIKEAIPTHWLTTFGTFESPASAETVLPHLQTSSIIHFACHGTHDTKAPLESALMIGNDKITVAQIMKQSGVAAGSHSGGEKRMGLAFLSACETAMGDEKLPDESIHLAATLLFAGFRSVVATMWTMKDEDGPEIAETFYGYLFRNVDPAANPPVFPDLNESAKALHLAVKKLRTKVSFARWVPFVHYGL